MLILKCPKVCTKKNTMERSHICIQIAIFKIKYSKIMMTMNFMSGIQA